MGKILYITANPKNRSESFSLQMGEAFIRAYEAIHPGHQIIRLDLYKQTPPEIDEDVLAAREQLQQGDPFRDLNPQQQQKLFAIHQMAEQFVQADKYVFVSPVWNWGIPPVLKMYLDAIVVPDKTVKWTFDGPSGLLNGKKALHLEARGYRAAEGEPDFSHGYLRHVLQSIGVSDIAGVRMEGVWQPDVQVDTEMDRLFQKLERMAIDF